MPFRFRIPLTSASASSSAQEIIKNILNKVKLGKKTPLKLQIRNIQKFRKMERIADFKVGPMPENSAFVKPLRIEFNQNEKKRFWDMIKVHESVSIIIYNSQRKVLVFVKQFRPAVFYSNALKTTGDNEVRDLDWAKVPAEYGVTVELCAGIVDARNKSLAEIAKQEVLEECGYDVPIEKFERVTAHRSGVGSSGEKNTVFYVDISDAMKVNAGGGLAQEGEFIDVVEMTIPEIKDYIAQEEVQSPGGFLFGVYWFLANKANK